MSTEEKFMSWSTYFDITPPEEYNFLDFYKHRSKQTDFTFSFRKESYLLKKDLHKLLKNGSETMKKVAIRLGRLNKILMATPRAGHYYHVLFVLHVEGHRKYFKDVNMLWNQIERHRAEFEASSSIMRDTTEAFKDSIVNINSSIKNVNSIMLKCNEELKGTENSENAECVLGKRRGTVSDGHDSLTESDGNESPCEMAIKRRMIQNASPSLISIMEKYRVKQTTSKFDLAYSFILDLTPKSKIEGEFGPKLWAELIADRPVIAKTEYHKEIESICNHLFSPLCKKVRYIWKFEYFVTNIYAFVIFTETTETYESRNKWKNLRDLKAPEYNDDFSYEKEDWEKILYWAERAVAPFLDAFESEYNPIQQHDCGEREWFGDYIIPIFKEALKLNTFCRVPCRLVCKINQQEIVCGLGCGGPHKYDLTKWGSDEYQLPRMLKDMLDDIRKNSK
ncbi:14978_t:CDS:2 [Acaulospora morrowiae]|uniref:14978_t:CDS:1 n=1 Tax=Acaulospora morrowiae TaxID=94023 RepID=A0A9N9G1W3_9GLOM|nr:14978_t:CDS:2 [Acaulospora morrowiae]